MPPILPRDTPVTKEDFDQSGWHAIIDGCLEKDTAAYSQAFFSQAEQAYQAGDFKRTTVFALLGDAASPALRGNTPNEPFVRFFSGPTGSTALPEDFTDDQLARLEELLPDAKDPEMRARLNDILWVRKRGHQFAASAIDSYLESAGNSDSDNWSISFRKIERATHLAVLLGRGEPFRKAIAHIEVELTKDTIGRSIYFPLALMRLLIEQVQGDPDKCVLLAQSYAQKAEAVGDWHTAREYLEVAAEWQ